MIAHTNIQEVRKKYASDNFIAFSVDIDWASDACIQITLDYLLSFGIPLTVFCTHPSKTIDSYRSDARVELGIHPNFCDQSSQGNTMDEVIDFCMELVPGARCVRGHRWFSNNDMYDRLIQRGIVFDSNESSMLDLVQPYIHRSGILRIPVFFEDGGFLWNGAELDFQHNGKRYFDSPGLKVLDLHPIHFALNCPTQSFYRHIGDTLPREEYSFMRAEQIQKIAHQGYGMRDYVMDLIRFVRQSQVNVVSLAQIYGDLIYY